MDGLEKLHEPPAKNVVAGLVCGGWKPGRPASPPSLTPREDPGKGLVGNRRGQCRWSDSAFVEQTATNLRELLRRPDSVMVTLLLSPSLIWI